ncbi:MAG: 16S rRNA (guanine(527)-N(7))-methyltransferase RsmG [Alphaproteobacteria bacterium]|nr:16S rRNA (guanine(527)-N(7))-methyltransferase RsmG [Alphaproteobacteria bacterium]
MKNLEKKYNVSRETIDKLKTYEASLNEWQQKFNLVSNSSLSNSWNRHFEDSMQLFSLLPESAKTLYDFGSGAGFPGMVLAIMAAEKTPYLKVNLVESIKKKTLYLNEVKSLTGINNVNIINDRVENLKTQVADVITSRAMTSLNGLLGYAHRFCGKHTKCIFPKGRSHQEEILEAQKNWKFNLEILQSTQSDEGVILIITNLSKTKGAK